MKAGWFSARSASSPLILPLLSILLSLVIVITTGCGSSNSTPPPPKLSGNTRLTVVLSSTANDQVTDFNLYFQTLTLTNQSGKSISLLASQQPSEFIHLNGQLEPLTTVVVPQDVYTAATVTLGRAEFVCLSQYPPTGGILISHYSPIDQPPVVNLLAPITITGDSMVLSLNLQVSSSAIFPSCYTSPDFEGYSMSPTFNLAPVATASSPSNATNGLVTGLVASVASVGTSDSSLTLTIPAAAFGTRTVTAHVSNATVFQGISDFSALSAGMFLNLDGALQSDGSLLATRIEVENPNAINVFTGPIMSIDEIIPVVQLYGRTELGPLLLNPTNNQPGQYYEFPGFDFSQATFLVSGQFTNLSTLPFVPSFNSSSFVAGQNVDVTSPTFKMIGGSGPYTPAETLTLIPQTIDGAIEGVSTAGNFTVYTVSLADYDLFPQLAVQQGQTTVLTDPSHVQVYVDNNTQKLNSQALAPGSTLRFYGLVFNDNGTLRMDCRQVSDGVAFSPQASASTRPASGISHIIQRPAPAGLRQIIATMGRQR